LGKIGQSPTSEKLKGGTSSEGEREKPSRKEVEKERKAAVEKKRF